jgi:cell division septum initiation protein DivIVA
VYVAELRGDLQGVASSIQPRFGNALPCKEKADMPPKLTHEIITAAIEGFETQKKRIDDQIAELRTLLAGGSSEPSAAPAPPKHKRRKMSAAGRKAIAEAQRKRWAASKKAAERPVPEVASKPKRKLSAAGRKAIIAATKKRWALKRSEAAKAS